jgi:hypothetical protein
LTTTVRAPAPEHAELDDEVEEIITVTYAVQASAL